MTVNVIGEQLSQQEIDAYVAYSVKIDTNSVIQQVVVKAASAKTQKSCLSFSELFSLYHRLVTKTVYRNNFKIIASRKLTAQLCHIYINGTGSSLSINVPEFIHKLSAGKGFFRVGQQLI